MDVLSVFLGGGEGQSVMAGEVRVDLCLGVRDWESVVVGEMRTEVGGAAADMMVGLVWVRGRSEILLFRNQQ